MSIDVSELRESSELYLDRLNAVRITREDIAIAVLACNDRNATDGNPFGEYISVNPNAIAVTFKECPEKRDAIYFRLFSLEKLIESNVLQGWYSGDFSGKGDYTNANVFVAAAEEPLIVAEDGEFCFEKESFKKRILELSEPAGRA